MSEELTTYQKLARQFPTDAHKTLAARGGQTYVPWNLVAERLNEELTVTGWSFAVVREGFTEAECWVLGRLTATIDGQETFREQYGCADLKLGQSFNTDLLKKAGTDSLKKCAQVLGVALYLTDADERADVQAAMQAEKQAEAKRQADERKAEAANKLTSRGRPAPTPIDARAHDAAVLTGADPVKSEERKQLEDAFTKGKAYARSINLDPADVDISDLDDAALGEVVSGLRTQCQYVLAERKKSAKGAA